MHTLHAKIRSGLLPGLLVLFATASAWAGPPLHYPTIGTIDRLDPALDKLIPKDAVIEVVATGFDWSEGPIWIKNPDYLNASNMPNLSPLLVPAEPEPGEPKPKPSDGFLLFSDIPRNSIMRWREGDPGVTVFMRPSGYTGVTPYGHEPGCNGLTVDREGRLTLCEHGDRRVSRLEKNGGKRTLADNYQGKRFNSPNDLVYHSSGALYFTDPPYGLPEKFDDPRRELDFCGVYRLAPDGQLTLLTKELSRPNGVALSPDEKTLYVAVSDPAKAIWMAYDLNKDGSFAKGRLLFDSTPVVGNDHPGLPDGLKTDKTGHIFATGPGGVYVFTPAGKHLGTVNVGEKISNCNWGNDGSVLYITADAYLCRIRTSTKGAGW